MRVGTDVVEMLKNLVMILTLLAQRRLKKVQMKVGTDETLKFSIPMESGTRDGYQLSTFKLVNGLFSFMRMMKQQRSLFLTKKSDFANELKQF